MDTITWPLVPRDRSRNVANLQNALIFLLDQRALAAGSATLQAKLMEGLRVELVNSEYGKATEAAIRQFQKELGLPSDGPDGSVGAVDKRTAEALNEALAARGVLITPPVVPATDGINPGLPPVLSNPSAADTPPLIRVRLWHANGGPAAEIAVRALSVGFLEKEQAIGKEAVTDAEGWCAFDAPAPLGGMVLKLLARNPRSDGTWQSLMKVRAVREFPLQLKLVVPAEWRGKGSDEGSEFARLVRDLKNRGVEIEDLAKAHETADRRDLSALHAATGWDARVLALASQAAKVAAGVKLPLEPVYGLLRSGVAATKQAVLALAGAAVTTRLQELRATGIIGTGDDDISKFVAAQREIATGAASTTAPPALVSSPNELFDGLKLSATDRKKWNATFASDWKTEDELWERARAGGLNAPSIERLQAHGALATLTSGNALLSAELLNVVKAPKDMPQLAAQGYFRPERWHALLDQVAQGSGTGLEKLLPQAADNTPVRERAAAYAEALATRVRQAYPTRVIAERLASDEFPSIGTPATRGGLRDLLVNADGLGYRIGSTPLGRFIEEHKAQLTQGSGGTASLKQLRQLHQLYQIAPDDAAMTVLSAAGVRSARDVAAYSRKEFVDRFAQKFQAGSADPVAGRVTASLVHRKAAQIDATIRGSVVLIQQAMVSPQVVSLEPSPAAKLATQQGIKQLATDVPSLSSLLGSQDYCECQHCRSVLSPAAYFVDLLHFIDPEAGPRKQELGVTPFEILMKRRPDLAHLELTCENTHTALPYIDLVNKTFEDYIKANAPVAAADNSGSLSSADLIAEPERIVDEVYDKLRTQSYPLSAPYCLWTATIRAYLAPFKASFAQVVELFTAEDPLIQPPAGAAAYDGAAVLAEQLGINGPEYKLLINAGGPSYEWEKLYGLAAGASTSDVGGNVQRLTQALGVEVKDLTDLLRTRYVNPQLGGLLLLQRLGVSADQVMRLKGVAGYAPLTSDETAALTSRLTALVMPDGTSGLQWVDSRWAAGAFDKVIVIARPVDGCDPEQMQPVFAKTRAPIDAASLLRLNVFVRLWKGLQWTIEELDEALAVFLPKPEDELPASVGTALRSALIGLAHVQWLANRSRLGASARLQVLALWSGIHTYGVRSLYAQLFLTSASATDREVFDDASGAYLQPGTRFLRDHLPAVQAATGTTAAEITTILADAAQLQPGDVLAFEQVRLTLPTVSLIYRYALIARLLKLPVAEFIAIRQLSRSDPFKPPRPDGVRDGQDDHAGRHTRRSVEAIEMLKAAGLKAAQLRFLLLDEAPDPSPLRRSDVQTLGALRGLTQNLARAREEQVLPRADEELTSELLKRRLAPLYPDDVLTQFLAMLDGSIRYTAWKTTTVATIPADKIADVQQLKATFDPIRDREGLIATGVVSDALRAAVSARDVVLKPLLDDIDQQARDFFHRFLDREPPPMFNDPGAPAEDLGAIIRKGLDFDKLFNDELHPAARRMTVARVLLPLTRRLAEQRGAAEALTVITGKDVTVIDPLIRESALSIEAPVAAGDVQPRPVDSIAVRVATGVLAEYFEGPDLTGPLLSRVQEAAELHDLPQKTRSVRFSGVMTLPETGAYRFDYRSGEAEEQFSLVLAGFPDQDLAGTAAAAGATASGPVRELNRDTLYAFTAEVRSITKGSGAFGIRSDRDPRIRSLADLEHWPAGALKTVAGVLARLDRLTLLMERLELSVAEVLHVLREPSTFGPAALAALPLEPVVKPDAGTHDLFEHVVAVARYRILRDSVSATSSAMLTMLRATRTTLPPGLSDPQARARATAELVSAVAAATGEPASQVGDALAALEFDSPQAVVVSRDATATRARFAGLATLAGVERLFSLLAMSRRLGLAPRAIRTLADSPPSAGLAATLRAGVKSRYGSQDWRRAVQPIADELRRQRRDALVQHLMWQKGHSKAEQLYEEFLIDPGMEPVVQTSRIRLAIASVQLFINRCLMRLEPDVDPGKINAHQWEWMRRYRIWEASRKILLFAANWAEPEFYDDASPLYKAMLGNLLQGDVDPDSVETAFFGYVQGLEQVARLQMVAMYCEESGTVDTGDDVTHVIGRTFSSPHKYFYRRFAHGRWSAWEAVGADIEGDHVLAVWWRSRLNLFWITAVEKSRTPRGGSSPQFDALKAQAIDAPALKAVQDLELRLNWCELVKGEWQPRQAGGRDEVVLLEDTGQYDPKLLFVTLRVDQADADGVRVATMYSGHATRFGNFHVRSRHAPVEVDYWPLAGQHIPLQGFTASGYTRWASATGRLAVTHAALFPDDDAQTNSYPAFAGVASSMAYVLPTTFADGVIPTNRALDIPFFYEDRVNTLLAVPKSSQQVETVPVYRDFRDYLDRYEVLTPPKFPIGPIDPRWRPDALRDIDSDSLVQPDIDWLVDRTTLVKVGERLVGPSGSFTEQELRRGYEAGRLGRAVIPEAQRLGAELGRAVAGDSPPTVSLLDLQTGRLEAALASGLLTGTDRPIQRIR